MQGPFGCLQDWRRLLLSFFVSPAVFVFLQQPTGNQQNNGSPCCFQVISYLVQINCLQSSCWRLLTGNSFNQP
jgi:hypothetical protein